ncbi:LysR substrate-binding domain-containing protein [Pigmentiphaga soli]|uniref:LysR substrate-binding domain-containing protein n=1 Tax=Pigmentiphaga soli TaxID=1007095 RepID=A0ABP8HDT9_9BURK
MRFDPISLRLFAVTCQQGSITASASRLGMALAAASRRIANLEADVGVPLLERLPRGVAPTTAGQALLRHAQPLIEDFDRMKTEMAEYAKGVRGHVRVLANRSAVVQFLPDDVMRFLARYPELRIELKEDASGAIVQALRQEATEVGIFESTTDSRGLQIHRYRSDELVVLVHREHRLAARRAVRFEELLDEEFVSLRVGTALHTTTQAQAQRIGAAMRIRMQVYGFDSMCQMVQARIGIGILPRRAVLPQLQSLPIRGIRLAEEWAVRQHCIGYRDYDTLSKPARSFVGFLRDCAAQAPEAPDAPARAGAPRRRRPGSAGEFG